MIDTLHIRNCAQVVSDKLAEAMITIDKALPVLESEGSTTEEIAQAIQDLRAADFNLLVVAIGLTDITDNLDGTDVLGMLSRHMLLEESASEYATIDDPSFLSKF